MRYKTLEDVIRTHIHLEPTDSRGWCKVLCRVCKDHGRKGKRAGFKFEGDVVGYNSFNCAHAAGYDPSEHDTMPDKMAVVLNAFGVPKDAVGEVVFGYFMNKPQHHDKTRTASHDPTPLPVPSFFEPLDDIDDDLHQAAIWYTETQRGITDWQPLKLMVARGDKSIPHSKKWHGRLILPVYKDGDLIFYQGRDITGTRQQKYLNPDVVRDKVLFGYDQLFVTPHKPLYVVEGWFDAHFIHGVAVFGNKMTDDQIHWLTKSPRPKVIIPDKYGDGQLLANQAISLGWQVSTPDIGTTCKDVSDAVDEYGLLYTIATIRDNTAEGFAAEMNVRLFCINEKGKQDVRKR